MEGRQAGRQANRLAGWQAGRQACRQTGWQAGRQALCRTSDALHINHYMIRALCI